MWDDEYPLCMDRPARKPPLTAYPALLWVTVLFALLGSFQFGETLPRIRTQAPAALAATEVQCLRIDDEASAPSRFVLQQRKLEEGNARPGNVL